MATIGFIGMGNIGYAILKSLLKVYNKEEITFTDLNRARVAQVERETGVKPVADNKECAASAKFVVLAVKPQFYDVVLADIAGTVTKENIIISIAPGITIDSINEKLGGEKRIVRAMPNTPALLGEGMLGGEKVVLVQPQTFMNLSGQSVVDVLNWYKITPEEALLIVDDIDLPMGQVRLRPHGGAGTHNGLRNIVYLTGSDRFPRIRVGVGSKPEGWDLADWVLSKYQTEEDRKIMFDAYCYAADAARAFVTQGIDKAMNLYNKR